MKAQPMEDSITTTQEGSLQCGRLSLLLILTLAACAPLPPGPDGLAEGEGPVVKGELAVKASPGDVSGAQISQVAAISKPVAPKPVAPKPVAPKPVAPKPVAPKPVANNQVTTRARVSDKASSSPKVESGIRSRSASVVSPKTTGVDQSVSSSIESVSVTATTRQASLDRAYPGAEAIPRPLNTRETSAPPVRVDDIGGEPEFQKQQYRAPGPLELPPIKSVKKVKPSAEKPGRRFPVKTEQVRIGASQIEMVALRGGVFQMGSSDGDYDERPLHEVSLRPFSIGRYEVTQQQWVSVMGENPSHFNDCATCPVDSVSWNDIQQFLEKINQLSDRRFRLPSEAEWEYACRAGGREAYCGDSDETQVSWYLDNSGGRSQPVGRLASNAFGLYDMSGNAYEWVEDCWNGGFDGAPGDGKPWLSGDCQRRVLRGGAWYYAAPYASASYRNANTPYSDFIIYGFRLAHDRE